jgi:hypothetical protein
MDMSRDEIATQAHWVMQDSIDNWGKLMIASGGAFKPETNSSYLISFKWQADGRWKYEANEQDDDFDLHVPLLDGSYVPIEPVSVDTSKETLGVWSCPSGN